MTPQSQTTSEKTWWELATQWSVVRRGITYAVFVGTALIVINHCDAIIRCDFTLGLFVKMALTLSSLPCVDFLKCCRAAEERLFTTGVNLKVKNIGSSDMKTGIAIKIIHCLPRLTTQF